MNNTCCSILKSGPRRGNECGKNGILEYNGNWYCGSHRPSLREINALCKYSPNGLLFQNIDFMDEDYVALTNLNGYINIRIGKNILYNNEKLSLVLMSCISPGEEHFTKLTLAKELKKEIEWVLDHPDLYDLAGYSINDLKLNEITYDSEHNIYVAEIDVI